MALGGTVFGLLSEVHLPITSWLSPPIPSSVSSCLYFTKNNLPVSVNSANLKKAQYNVHSDTNVLYFLLIFWYPAVYNMHSARMAHSQNLLKSVVVSKVARNILVLHFNLFFFDALSNTCLCLGDVDGEQSWRLNPPADLLSTEAEEWVCSSPTWPGTWYVIP